MYFIKGKINFWSLKFSLGCMYIIEFPNSSISPLEFVFLVATLVSRPLYANSKEELTWYLFIIKNNFLNLLIIKLYIHTHIFHFFFFRSVSPYLHPSNFSPPSHGCHLHLLPSTVHKQTKRTMEEEKKTKKRKKEGEEEKSKRKKKKIE